MPSIKCPIKIGVTGSIAAGKSTVCKMLSQKLACPYINSDEMIAQMYLKEAREIFADHPMIYELISHQNQFVLEKERLKAFILENPQELRRIMDILYPILKKRFEDIARISHELYIVYEVPLLFESPLFNHFFDITISVDVGCEKTRLMRLSQRHGNNELYKKLFDIVATVHFSQEKKNSLADHIVKNTETMSQLSANLDELIKIL